MLTERSLSPGKNLLGNDTLMMTPIPKNQESFYNKLQETVLKLNASSGSLRNGLVPLTPVLAKPKVINSGKGMKNLLFGQVQNPK